VAPHVACACVAMTGLSIFMTIFCFVKERKTYGDYKGLNIINTSDFIVINLFKAACFDKH